MSKCYIIKDHETGESNQVIWNKKNQLSFSLGIHPNAEQMIFNVEKGKIMLIHDSEATTEEEFWKRANQKLNIIAKLMGIPETFICRRCGNEFYWWEGVPIRVGFGENYKYRCGPCDQKEKEKKERRKRHREKEGDRSHPAG